MYRINQTFIWSENSSNQFARTGPGVAFSVKEEIPEIETMTSIHTPGSAVIAYAAPGNEVVSIEQEEIFAVDTSFFKMFNFPFVYGSPKTALRTANTVVFKKETAESYFGKTNPVGQFVMVGGGADRKAFEVTGVIEVPENSSIQFDALFSIKNYPGAERTWSWVWTQLETYIRLIPDADINNVKAKLAKVPEKHVGKTLEEVFKVTYEEYIKSGKKWELFLQPMTKLHLPDQVVAGDSMKTGNSLLLYSLIATCVFIVVLSCINFTNLSMAQFTRRVKEASLRKILGMGKRELVFSFLIEAIAFCLISLVIGIAITQLALPAFSFVVGSKLSLELFDDKLMIPAGVGIAILMAIVSSIYPVVYLNAFNPVEGIKGKGRKGPQRGFFQNGMVVFQFSVSIILIICTAVVFQQLSFLSEKDLGFDKENVAVIKHVQMMSNSETLANEARKLPGVIDASVGASAPPEIFDGDSFDAEGTERITLPLNFARGDENYIPSLGIKLIYGRNFAKENLEDLNRVILNEAAIKKIGWNLDETVIGKRIIYENNRFEVVGVISDFNYWTTAALIEPLGIFHIDSKNLYDMGKKVLIVRLKGGTHSSMESTLSQLNALWKKTAGDLPFQYSFIDETFSKQFITQERFGNVLTVMAALGITIACLGLLGMIIYALEQRTKEIGIRKVNGASVVDILLLISRSYTRLIIIAFVIGAPAAWYMMTWWLNDFAYRVQPSAWIFIGTGVGILLIAMLITGYHSLKASTANPVTVLRDE